MWTRRHWLRFGVPAPRHWIGPLRYDLVNDLVLWLEPVD